MAQLFHINCDNPQNRLISRAAEILLDGGVAVYPTDSCYAIGCQIGSKVALDRIRQIRGLDERHNLSLMCKDLSEISNFARVTNEAFRLMKMLTPGPYTFLLLATRDVPKRLMHPKRKTIGVRIPDNAIILAILEQLNQPLLTTSLILPDQLLPMTEPEEINSVLGDQVDLIIDGGVCGLEPTTVIDLIDQTVIVRHGKGEISAIGS